MPLCGELQKGTLNFFKNPQFVGFKTVKSSQFVNIQMALVLFFLLYNSPTGGIV